jgi:hypothetical protein
VGRHRHAHRSDADHRCARTRWRWPAFAAAASLLLAVAALATLRMQAPPTPSFAAEDARAAARREDARPNDDPRLLAAAIVLDSAHAELQQALAQHPDSPFLVDLLNRTQARRDKLDHFGANAG